MTDANSSPTAAEWAAGILATLPRLTDEQWNTVNATLGITTTARPARATEEDQRERVAGAAA